MKLPLFISKVLEKESFSALIAHVLSGIVTAVVFMSITQMFSPKLETEAQKQLQLEIQKSIQNDRIQDIQINDLQKQLKDSQQREISISTSKDFKIDSIINRSFDDKFKFLLERSRSTRNR